MIRRLVRQMLTAQILSACTVSLCLLIDSIMVGRFLGERALTAYGLASPVLLSISAVASMLSAGIQVACSKSLGRSDREETDIGYSTAIAAGCVFALAFTLPALLLHMPIARLLGANTPELLRDTGSYIAGFSIGAPATIGALVLVPFLQMAGQSSLLIAAVLCMTVTDVAFDLLNVYLFHCGMFGMGLASAISYYAAAAIASGYFLTGKSVFSFSWDRIHRRKMKELITGGIPSLVGITSSVLLIFVVNWILLGAGGAAAVAAFSVINSIMNICNSISSGSGGVALTLSGVLYNEEDRMGLTEMLRAFVYSSIVLGVGVMVFLMIFARPCVELFIPGAGESQDMAIRGLRLFSTGLVFCCFSNVLRNCYLGTGRVHMMEVISVFANAVLPGMTAFLFSRIAGVNGAWFLFTASEILTILGIFCYIWLKKGGVTWRAEDILMLRPDYGVPPEDLLEASPASLEDVAALSRKAEAFCRAHGSSRRLGSHLALCIEEMGGNIVTHGFTAKGKNSLSVRLQYQGGCWKLRFRDDCREFDPIRHISEHNTRGNLGIHLAMSVADEARYTYSMNMNNLMLILRETE